MTQPAPAPATVTVYGPDDVPEQVTPEDAAALLKTGRYGMADGDALPMRSSATGEIELVPAAQAVQRAQFEGSGATSFERYRDQELGKSYDTVGNKALAFGTGALNSLGLGFGDAGLAKLGDALGQGRGIREELANQQRFLPGYRMAGEGVGFLAPLIASGGSSLAARGLTSGGRALAAGGAAVEGATARGLARVGIAEGGILSRGVSSAAGQALELGVFSAGEATSRAVVQNPGLTGEQAMAAAGHGFLHGAAYGAAGGALFGGGAAALGRLGRSALGGATTLAERLTGRTSERAAGTVGEKVTKLVDTLAPGGVEAYAVQKGLKSTGANQKILGEAEKLSGEVREIAAQIVVDRLPLALGKQKGAILSHVEQAEAIAIVRKEVGENIGKAVEELDQLQTKIRPDMKAITQRAKGEILAELKSNPFTKNEAAAVEMLVKDLAEYAPRPTFGALHDLRATLDKKIKFDASSPTLLTQAHKEFRNIIEDELMRSGELAAKEAGGSFAKRYGALKRDYVAAKWVEKATNKGADRDLANRSAGFSEQIGANTGASAGATAGAALAGPVGAAVGAAVGGLGSAYANHLVKRYGDQAVASMLRRAAAQGGDITMAASLLLEEHMGKAVVGYLKGGAEKAVATAGRVGRGAELVASESSARKKEPLEKRYARAVESVTAAKAGTGARQQQIADAMPRADLRAVQASQATHARAIDAAFAAVPKPPARGATLTPHISKTLPSPSEQAKFLRTLDAIEDPATVLDSLAKGTISAEEIAALKTVYPEMYADLQAKFMTALVDQKTELPYAKALALGQLLGVPAHASMTPAFIAAQQAAFAPSAPAQPPSSSKPVDVADAYKLEGLQPMNLLNMVPTNSLTADVAHKSDGTTGALSDALDLQRVAVGICLHAAGTVRVTMLDQASGEYTDLPALAVGVAHGRAIKRIWSTGTTVAAANLEILYQKG